MALDWPAGYASVSTGLAGVPSDDFEQKSMPHLSCYQ